MNIGITGHTKGLGKILFDHFLKKYEIKGFSRSNGYDIKNPFDRKKIIKESTNFDIFINLVHNYYHQTDLLYELHKNWSGQQKLIICIGSKAIHRKNFGENNYQLIEYKTQKTALFNMFENLNYNFEHPVIKHYEISEINFDEDIKNLNNLIENEYKLFKK
jgi:hypothetical protein